MSLQKHTTKDSVLAVFADKKQSLLYLSHYLTVPQKREVIKKLGYICLIVLDYYFFKASVKNNEFSDGHVAKELGMPERTVQKARQKLVNAGWFCQITYSHEKATPMLVTVLGQENVRIFKKNQQSSISDLFKKILSATI